MQGVENTTLSRQLRRLKLSEDEAPSPEQWRKFLDYLDRYYKHVAEDRDMLAHSLDVSTEEMSRLREEVLEERDQLRQTLTTFQEALDDFAEACRLTRDTGGESTTAITGTRKRFNLAVIRLMSMINEQSSENRDILNALRISFVKVFEEVISMVSPGRTISDEMIHVHQSLIGQEAQLQYPGAMFSAKCEQLNGIGGDLWSCRELKFGQLFLSIGDATGHGSAAGMLSAIVAAMIEGWADAQQGEAWLEPLHQSLQRAVKLFGNGKLFMTWCGMLLDKERESALIINAGQPFPILIRDEKATSLVIKGNPLGSPDGDNVRQGRFTLQTGDRLFCFSDGLTEVLSPFGGEFGERGLKAFLEQNRDVHGKHLLESLFQEARTFCEHNIQDDMTAFVAAIL